MTAFWTLLEAVLFLLCLSLALDAFKHDRRPSAAAYLIVAAIAAALVFWGLYG